MGRRSYRPEEIINKLREAEVLLSQGSTVGEASKRIEVTEQTYYRWRREYGGMRVDQARRLKELEKENSQGKLLSPSKRRRVVSYVCRELGVSERRACRVLGQARATQRRPDQVTDEELRLVARIIGLATHYGRYGYRRITALLQEEGWKVNHKRVERIWRRE